jgi:hypothetical protein
MTFSIKDTQHYAERHNVECRIIHIVMLNVIMASVTMLNVIIASVTMLNVIMTSVTMLNVIILSVFMLSVTFYISLC